MTEDAAGVSDPPPWAMEAARSDLYDAAGDSDLVRGRAWQLVNERAKLDHERHDEFDDPDSGGEG